MACINPLTIYQKFSGKTITVPCNHCLNCLIRKQSQLEFLAKKELIDVYTSGRGASFVTLTYDNVHVPRTDDGFITLKKEDLRNFFKSVRRQMEYHGDTTKFKYIACGEYGDNYSCRCHFHIVFLGLTDVQALKYTNKVWKNGNIDIGPLSSGGLSYVCKYLSKQHPDKDIKQLRSDLGCENPFLVHSIGLGKKWIMENIYNILDNRFVFTINGKKCLYPKYVMEYVKARTGCDYKKYVVDFISHSDDFNYAKSNNLDYIDFSYEKTYLHYKHLITALRSRNMAVDDITLSRAWVKPKHQTIRKGIKDELTELALYGDVVPF